MPTDAEIYAKLPSHKKDIWDGKTSHSPEVRAAFMARWRGDKSVRASSRDKGITDCIHLGGPHELGTIDCPTCPKGGKLRFKTFHCGVYGRCAARKLDGVPGHCTKNCPGYDNGDKEVEEQETSVKSLEVVPPIPVPPELRMKAPGEHRKGVWLNGVLQIMVTRACDRSCNNCTQGSNLKGPVHFMPPEQFRIAVESLKDYFGVVGVFGGNPCLHPQFDELCTILRGEIPWERRGLWSNHPKGMGKHAAITFNPAHSNLNVHQSQEAWDEFARDWPECVPFLKGLDTDSRHSPPFVAMKDVIEDEAERWRLIHDCDINKNWSALIGVFRGELRGWFCEVAGAQAMLHQDDPDYPDTGVPIMPGWWKQGREAFAHQVRKHCHECSIPLKGYGALANSDEPSQFSVTHADIYRTRGGSVQQVTELIQLGSKLPRVTDYIENGSLR